MNRCQRPAPQRLCLAPGSPKRVPPSWVVLLLPTADAIDLNFSPAALDSETEAWPKIKRMDCRPSEPDELFRHAAKTAGKSHAVRLKLD